MTQIVEKGTVEEIDTVTRATCSSNAIIEGCRKALEAAKRPEAPDETRQKNRQTELMQTVITQFLLYASRMKSRILKPMICL